MRVSTRNISMASTLCFVVVAMVCLSTGQEKYEDIDASITVVNNLEQSLVFREIKNRQAIQIKSDPPAKILPHSSGQFKISGGTSMENEHLNIKYTIEDTADQIGIVYKEDWPGEPHCPKEHPDWTTETVEHCGNFDKAWTYMFAPK